MCRKVRTTGKAVLVIWILGCSLNASGQWFAGGTGTPGDPYQVATAQQLRFVGYDPNQPHQCFVLVNDIDLDPNLPGGQVFHWAVVLLPNGTTTFEGVLDGGGHRIANMTIETLGGSGGGGGGRGPANVTVAAPGAGWNYLGLFPRIGPGGRVRNLGLVNARIKAGASDGRVGALAGENQGTISDCFATGVITGGMGVGGLVGVNRGTLIHCRANCAVTASTSAGGLVGADYGTILYCGAEGAVTGTGFGVIGGLAGESTGGEIMMSRASGAVTGARNIGGLIGAVDGSAILRCYATGAVQGETWVGGLVGSAPFPSGDIAWCYAGGPVRSTTGDEVGGLVGLKSTGVRFCYFLDPREGGGPDNGFGTPLTDAQMRRQTSFADWDFENVWRLCEGQDYPRLWWERRPCPQAP
jgi:hypothetical protein